MAGTAMSFLLSFIVLPSPSAENALFRSLLTEHYAACILVPRGEMTRKSGVNVT